MSLFLCCSEGNILACVICPSDLKLKVYWQTFGSVEILFPLDTVSFFFFLLFCECYLRTKKSKLQKQTSKAVSWTKCLPLFPNGCLTVKC